ncbi:hypothetical protein [Nocardia alba]|uniref:Quercetin dioxygenase-like cupin family protein n=1 Tax=Nocardia alba TaxID=225051 RepID=A0A4R1FU52_9NOCA|nr:hypothetical protein [Nocardia alba]TCJ97169.1 quercetin dioxygenase-like cupin family protein [Nocardia alba]
MTETAIPLVDATTAWHPRDGIVPNAQRLLSGAGLTLVRISFRAGQILDDHRAGGPILIQCVSGAVDVDVTTDIEVRGHHLVEGSVLHIDANLVHRLTAELDTVVLVVLHRKLAD